MRGRQLLVLILPLLLLISCEYITYDDPSLSNYPSGGTGSAGKDSFESNDSWKEAKLIKIGAQNIQSHTINREGDIDYLKFSGRSGLTYRINLSSIKGFEPEMSLYQSDGTTLIERKSTGSYTGTYDWWGYNKDRAYLAREKESILFTPAADGTYFISIKDIYDAHDKGSYKIQVTELIIIEKVMALTAQPNESSRSIDLSWTTLSGVDGYNIYRTEKNSPGYNDFTPLDKAGANESTYSDTNISLEKSYYYYVAGYKSNTVGEPSDIVSSQLSINIPAPANLQAQPINREFLRIGLTWHPLTDADGYNIYYKTGSTSYTLLATVPGKDNNAYTHKDILPGTTYEYKVAGYILNSEGAMSTPASALYDWTAYTPSTAPITASENLTALIEITLAEKQTHNGIVRYDIYRTERGSAAAPVKIDSFQADAPIGSKLQDNTVTAGTYYDYSVKIVFNNGITDLESNYSVTDSGYSW